MQVTAKFKRSFLVCSCLSLTLCVSAQIVPVSKSQKPKAAAAPQQSASVNTNQTIATPQRSSNAYSNQTSAAPASGTINASSFAAGVGAFNVDDFTLTVFNCLRSGTRVFCDYDVNKTQSRQVNASGFQRYGLTLVAGAGRVFGSQRYMYVDTDGSTFDLAEISPNTPVRLVNEYDDVPSSYTSITLALGSKRVQNIPITLIPDGQAANTIPLRQVQVQAQNGFDGQQAQAQPPAQIQQAAVSNNQPVNNNQTAASSQTPKQQIQTAKEQLKAKKEQMKANFKQSLNGLWK